MIIWPSKAPEEVEDFAFDFTPSLESGETLIAQALTADGVTLDSSAIVLGVVQAWLSGGTAGTVAKVQCTVTTSLARTYSELAVLAIAGEAVRLADAKAHARIDSADEDVLLAGLLRSALGHIEALTGKCLTAKVVTQTVDGFPGSRCAGAGGYWLDGYPGGIFTAAPPAIAGHAIRLWKGPASAILSVKYDDPDGIEQTLASFRLVEGANAKLLPAYGERWPATAFGPGSVRLTYIAGYDPAELPPELTQAALMLFSHFYANREAVLVDTRAVAVELPLGVQALTAPYCAPGIA